MKTFKHFIRENEQEDDHGYEAYFTPGRHLRMKREVADKDYDKTKGIGAGSSVTAQFTKNVRIPTRLLDKTPGAHGEHETRNDPSNPKNVSLEKEVGDPKNFDTEKNPIAISVNHRGEPFVQEGNHRIAYARRHGISHVNARVSYHLGGEGEKGPYHPDKVKKMSRPQDNVK